MCSLKLRGVLVGEDFRSEPSSFRPQAPEPEFQHKAADANDKATHYQLAQLYAHLKQPDKSEYHMEIFRKLYEQERDKSFKQNQRAIQKALDSSSN